jgi:hypothetical protein
MMYNRGWYKTPTFLRDVMPQTKGRVLTLRRLLVVITHTHRHDLIYFIAFRLALFEQQAEAVLQYTEDKEAPGWLDC